MAELARVGADPSKVKPVHPAVECMDGTYDTMSGHGGAGDAHRVVCPYNILAERVCILAAVEKLVQD